MSRLAFRSPEKEVAVDTSQPVATHHILLEATCRPIHNNDYDKQRVEFQQATLTQLRNDGKDIFEMNETRKVKSAGKVLYQTTETYGTSMSVEKIVETLKKADLTLRVNFHRPGVHSSTTCMELSAATLQSLVAAPADAHGHKIAQLCVREEKAAKVPRHGHMFVAITTKGTQHYLSHIDYKIMGAYDSMYHEGN
tara:strand:- start:41 stop:625 length:585 start_codon:yes stop_codon:yes gene_type:complete